jgi:hypothetical protein
MAGCEANAHVSSRSRRAIRPSERSYFGVGAIFAVGYNPHDCCDREAGIEVSRTGNGCMAAR